MSKIAIYEDDEFGTRDYVEVFFEEDFLNGHPMLPSYVQPRYDDDGHICPVQVNSAGGYCWHIIGEGPFDGTHIVEYRDYDEDGAEHLTLEEMHPINRPEFNCGWIAPDGTTYQCAPEGHSACADRIVEETFDGHCRNGERELEERGWCKVYHESEIGGRCSFLADDHGIFWDQWAPDAMTPQQISVIKRIGRWTDDLQATIRMCSEIEKRER